MKQFACKDLGMDCNFVASGETVDEVKMQVLEHAQIVHADVVRSMSSTPEQMVEMDQVITRNIH